MADPGLIPGSGRCPGEGNGNPPQESCLEKSMDKGAWGATSPWDHKESDMTERLTLFCLSLMQKWSEVKWRESRSVVSDSLQPHGLYSPWNPPGQNTGVGSLSLLQGSPQPRDWTQVSHNAGGFFTSWATREAQEYWSGQPFPSPGISPSQGSNQVYHIASGFITSWATRAAPLVWRAQVICWTLLCCVSAFGRCEFLNSAFSFLSFLSLSLFFFFFF